MSEEGYSMNMAGVPRLASDKNFMRAHTIRKQEQKIIALVSVLCMCKTDEAQQEILLALRTENDKLVELEVIDV
jgi:hypothetical protein